MNLNFTAFNIVLDDGTQTKPEVGHPMSQSPWFLAAKRCLHALYPQGFAGLRIADLGCLKGGYTVEFARLGFGEALGLEVRPANFANCMYVKQRVNLPNLTFRNDDIWNLPRYGTFDVIFCGGVLYHLDAPKRFLDLMATVVRKAVLVNTHFATTAPISEYELSDVDENEGLPGRWFTEPTELEANPWAAWGNRRSFWIQREFLIQAIRDAGFPLVFEQYDLLGDDLATSMVSGYYRSHNRGMFVGVKV
jgi:SAM-dependent methyltransferase